MATVLSDRIQSIKPSPTLTITAKAIELKAQGRAVISLSAGEPDFNTPEAVKQAGILAISENHTKYTAVDGTMALKNAIIAKMKRDNGLDYEPKQILASCGAKHSIFNLFQAILNPGDEVIIPAPYWVSYPDMTLLCDAKPVVLQASLENQLKITAEQLAAAITPKTKCFVLNTPSNPTGMAYTKAELQALGEVLKAHPQIIIMSDDIYEHIYWAEEPYHNLVMACPELYDRTIVVNGVSKAYAMTGWRLGFAAGDATIIGAMKKMQSQSTSCPSAPAQAAAAEALGGDQSCLEPMVAAFKRRHDMVVAALNRIPGFTCLPGYGTFYAFPCIDGAMKKLGISDDVEFAGQLLEKAEVAAVPGSAFGMPGYIRFSFAVGEEILQEALKRIEAFATGG